MLHLFVIQSVIYRYFNNAQVNASKNKFNNFIE